jgi:hypothetical protein
MSDMTTVTAPATARRLARVHLRTGLLRLARAELEQLAGDDALDDDGVLDLAEARWRTGDLRGAAVAAEAWLDSGVTPVNPAGNPTDGDDAVSPRRRGPVSGRSAALAHALVADGLSARGREDDAAVHVLASLDALADHPGKSRDADLDALFAGMTPRSDAWPAFGSSRGATRQAEPTAAAARARTLAGDASSHPGSDPITAAQERLRAGDDVAAAVLFVLALRTTPERAAQVLEAIGGAIAARPGAALLLARAEALRALGRPEAAAIAYAAAEAQARNGTPGRSPGPARLRQGQASRLAAAPAAATPPDPERRP